MREKPVGSWKYKAFWQTCQHSIGIQAGLKEENKSLSLTKSMSCTSQPGNRVDGARMNRSRFQYGLACSSTIQNNARGRKRSRVCFSTDGRGSATMEISSGLEA